jgi:hypothetical protein
MTLVEALVPLRVTLRARGVTVVLRPGQPTPFDDDEARRLLERLRGKVRAIPAPEATTKAPGPCPGCGGPLSPFAEYDTATATYRRGLACQKCGHEAARPPETAEAIQFEPAPHPPSAVFWESRGRILGPARVVAFAKAGEEFWLLIEHGRESRWIRDNLLRSKRDYETQQPLRPTEPVREAH